jgi:hypothetical protein
MKDSVAKLLIACRFDLFDWCKHERHGNKRRLVGDATSGKELFQSDDGTTEVTHLSRSFTKSSMLPFTSMTTRANDGRPQLLFLLSLSFCH